MPYFLSMCQTCFSFSKIELFFTTSFIFPMIQIVNEKSAINNVIRKFSNFA